MPSIIYNSAKLRILQGEFDFINDDFKVALVTTAYTPDKDAHEFFSDISNEVSGTNYTAGGKALANISLSQDDANDRAILDADDLVWSVASFTARAAVIYKSTGSAATSPLLAYIDFEEDLEAAGEDFILQWHADGIFAVGE
jgi:hypothetical protein